MTYRALTIGDIDGLPLGRAGSNGIPCGWSSRCTGSRRSRGARRDPAYAFTLLEATQGDTDAATLSRREALAREPRLRAEAESEPLLAPLLRAAP